MKRKVRYVAVCALLALACGDDSEPSSGGSANTQVCYDLCQAQDAAEMAGNCPGIGLGTCKTLCDAIAGAECETEHTALNQCMLTGTFDCGLISAESDANCSAELSALDTCQNGSTGAACTGADANGRCPSVACPCPGGDQSINGTTTEGGQCACLDETTCQDLCF